MDPLLIAFWGFAVTDWVAVAREHKPLEYVAKPATLLALLAWAAQHGGSPWLLAALGFSLLGDVFLMLPVNAFIAGLGSFLVGHLAYLGAFHDPWQARLGWLAVLLITQSPLTRRLLGAVDEPPLRIAVAIYVLAISTMVASALSSGAPRAIVGAFLFMGSDLMIGWSRFVEDWSWARLGIIVTYHLGQLLITSALLTA